MRRLRPASPLRTPLRRLPRRERLNEPHLTRTGDSGVRVGAVWGMDGRGVVLAGLLWRSGVGACPNLPQRRPGPGSAAKKSAEYQRFFSRAPARSGPLWQIWTTLAAADPREPPGRAPRTGRWPGQASGRAAPGRATTTTGTPASERGPQATETASPDDPRRRNVHFALESAVPTVILECKMHLSTRKGPAAAAADRDDDPAVHDDPDLQAATSGEKGSMRAQLAKIHLSSHDVSSARQNPPQLDSCELSSHDVS